MLKIKSCYLPKNIKFIENQISIGVMGNSSVANTVISIQPNIKGEMLYFDLKDKDAKEFADSIYSALRNHEDTKTKI